MTRHAITNRSDEILAGTREFVPPALDVIGQENSEPVVDWRVAMKLAIRSSHELRQHLALSPPNEEPRGGICREVSDPSLDLSTEPVQIAAEKDFPTFVPLEYVQRIRRGDPRDPLLLQVMPVPEEDKEVAGFVSDPVGDLKVMPASGVLHKYHGRALVVTTGACGIHCRYCFRREFPYSENSTMGRLSETVLDFLQQHQEVEEVHHFHFRILFVVGLVLGPPFPGNAVRQFGQFLGHGPAIVQRPLGFLLFRHPVGIDADPQIQLLLLGEDFSQHILF